MTDDERRLVREAADRMYRVNGASLSDAKMETVVRPLLDEMARLTESRDEAERRENEARTDREVMERRISDLEGAQRILAESAASHAKDAREARDRLSRVKAAVDALRAKLESGDLTGMWSYLAAVDRALAYGHEKAVTSKQHECSEGCDHVSDFVCNGTRTKEREAFGQCEHECHRRVSPGDFDEKTGTLPGA